jgi:hypothetical protein
MASVHPVLQASSWCVSVSIQTKRRIDRRCPHSDRQIIQCYCLRCSSSAIHQENLQNGPSVHPTGPTSFCLLRSVPTTPTLWTDGTVGSSDGVFFLPFLRVFNLDLCLNFTSLTYLTCHYLWPQNIYYVLSFAVINLTCSWYVNLWYDMLTWAWYVNLCMVC